MALQQQQQQGPALQQSVAFESSSVPGGQPGMTSSSVGNVQQQSMGNSNGMQTVRMQQQQPLQLSDTSSSSVFEHD
jgi:hypothetical protein